LAASALLAIVLLGNFLLTIPERAAEQYGPPSSQLTSWEVYVLSTRLLSESDALQYPALPEGDPKPFAIALGEPTISVIQRLESQGLITNADAFRRYLQYTGIDTRLQAGEFTLDPGMSALEIAQALQDSTPETVSFTILAGWRLEEVAEALKYTGLYISAEDFISTAQNTVPDFPSIVAPPPNASLEGFLFPGTYELPRDLNAQKLLNLFLQQFDAQVTQELRKAFERQGLTLFEAVTLASIAQREAIVSDELPAITGVYLNRLRAGMKLEADPTVQYAVGYNAAQQTWWTNPLSFQDLAIDSDYNTYVYPGLPPGPIANPGMAALQAVAYPEDSAYYFFRARCDGSGLHLFAVTYEEHLKNACPSQP
jgi:UPF0755 protein